MNNLFIKKLTNILYEFVVTKPYIFFFSLILLSKEIYVLEVESLVVLCFFLFLYFISVQIAEGLTSSLDAKYEGVRRDFYSYLFFLGVLNQKLTKSYNESKFLILDIDNLMQFIEQYFVFVKTNKLSNTKAHAVKLIQQNLTSIVNDQKSQKKALILSILNTIFEKQLIEK